MKEASRLSPFAGLLPLASACLAGASLACGLPALAAPPSAKTAVVGRQSSDSDASSARDGDVLEYRRAPDGLFYVVAMVNGAPVRFLVDTGATVVILTAADARRVSATADRRRGRVNVETVGGMSPMAWTTLRHVRLGSREIRELRAIVGNEGVAVSILGQNLLSQLASLTIRGDRLEVR